MVCGSIAQVSVYSKISIAIVGRTNEFWEWKFVFKL